MTIPKNPIQSGFDINKIEIAPGVHEITIEEVLKFPVPDNINDGEELEDLFPLPLDISPIIDDETQNIT